MDCEEFGDFALTQKNLKYPDLNDPKCAVGSAEHPKEVHGTVAQPDMVLGYGERPAEEPHSETGLSPVQNRGVFFSGKSRPAAPSSFILGL